MLLVFVPSSHLNRHLFNLSNETRASCARSVSKVVSLFTELNIDVVTRWRQAHNYLTESDEWRSGGELRKLLTLDILLAFEDYSRVRERVHEEQLRTQVERTRKERETREEFKICYLRFIKRTFRLYSICSSA